MNTTREEEAAMDPQEIAALEWNTSISAAQAPPTVMRQVLPVMAEAQKRARIVGFSEQSPEPLKEPQPDAKENMPSDHSEGSHARPLKATGLGQSHGNNAEGMGAPGPVGTGGFGDQESWPPQRGVTWAKEVEASVNGTTIDSKGHNRLQKLPSFASCCIGHREKTYDSEHNEGAVLTKRGGGVNSVRYGPGKIGRCIYSVHRLWKMLQLALSSKVLLWLWCILGISVAIFVLIKGVTDWKRTHQQRLQTTCELQKSLLEDRFKENVIQLAEFKGLILPFYAEPVESSAPLLTQNQFYAFANQTHASRPLVQGVGFVLRVLEKERAAFEKAQHQPILDLFTGKPRAAASMYTPIIFGEGSVPGLLDIAQDPVQLSAMVRSMRSGQLAITEPYSETLILLRNVSFGGGYPIFKSIDESTATEEEREANLVGWLGASFNFIKIVELVLKNDTLNSDTLTWIYDCTPRVDNASAAPFLLFDPTNGRPVTHHGSAKVPLSLTDPARFYSMHCSYKGHVPVPVRTIEWTIAVLALVFLVSQLLRISGKRIQTLEDTFEHVRSMNQQLLEAKVAAESADTIKSQFLATVSHEIRTPLNGVLGMLSLLRDTKLDATQVDYIQTARASGKSLMVLINDVLDFSKIEAGRMEIESVPFDLRDEVDDVVSMFGDSIRVKDVELAALVQPGVPSVLLGDAGRFRQVLINLIGNATKFTDQGHIFISVRIAASNEDLEQTHEIPLPTYLRKYSRGTSDESDISDAGSAASSAVSSPHHPDSGSRLGHMLSDSIRTGMGSRLRPNFSFAKLHLPRLQSSNKGSSPMLEGGSGLLSPGGSGTTSPRAVDGPMTPRTALVSNAPHMEEPGSDPMHTLSGRAAANLEHTYARMARWMTAPIPVLVDEALTGSRNRGSDQITSSRKGILSASRKGMVRLAIAVEDTGQGIPKAAQQRIFQPWMQADSSTSRRAGGTGIGLTISHRLVALMGGKMQFVSKPNVGTTFYFDLHLSTPPVGAAKPVQVLDDGSGEAHSVPNMGRLCGLRVLVVDSHLVRREVLAGHLAGLGIQVEVVSTSQDAVDILTGSRPASGADLSSFDSAHNSGSITPATFASDAPNQGPAIYAKYASGNSAWTPGPELINVAPHQHGSVFSRPSSLKSLNEKVSPSITSQGGGSASGSAQGASQWSSTFAAVIVDSDCACHRQRGLELPPMLEKALGGVPGCLPPFVLLMQRPDPLLEQEAREAFYGAVLLKPLRKTSLASALLQALGFGPIGPMQAGLLHSSSGASLTDILKGKRILCVDDNPVNRRVANKMLAKHGVESVSASSGTIAIEAMRPPHDIDLVLMDIQMPEMDGYEACQKIREMEKAAKEAGMNIQSVPIVAMTADVLKGTREQCLRAGMDGYITKPMDSMELYNLVVKFFPVQ